MLPCAEFKLLQITNDKNLTLELATCWNVTKPCTSAIQYQILISSLVTQGPSYDVKISFFRHKRGSFCTFEWKRPKRLCVFRNCQISFLISYPGNRFKLFLEMTTWKKSCDYPVRLYDRSAIYNHNYWRLVRVPLEVGLWGPANAFCRSVNVHEVVVLSAGGGDT